MTSQTMAPIRADRTTRSSTTLVSTIPLPMVLATWMPRPKAATKLKKAAQTTACKGLRTRVETIVATELAASWNPLKKSKTRATTTMEATNSTSPSIIAPFRPPEKKGSLASPQALRLPLLGMFEDDRLQDVSDLFAAVSRPFQLVVNVAPLDDIYGAHFALEHIGHGVEEQGVRFVLQPVHLSYLLHYIHQP